IAESSIKPVGPKKAIVFSGALALTFLLGFIWVTIKELFNNKILFRGEIEAATKIPIIAEISYSGVKDHIIIDHPKKHYLTEQFRQLRAAVGLYGKSSKKIFLVTSAISSEGKSFVSANFATSLARSNKK